MGFLLVDVGGMDWYCRCRLLLFVNVTAMLTCESSRLLGKRCLPKSPIERFGCNEGEVETRLFSFSADSVCMGSGVS